MLATNPSTAAPATTGSRPEGPGTAPGAEFDLACITLISNLESIMASFREQSLPQRVEAASKTAGAIMLTLLDFSDKYFDDEQAECLRQEILQTSDARNAHDAVLVNRPWGTALKNMFRSGHVDPGAMSTYEHLGGLLLRTCGTAFVELSALVDGSATSGPIKQSSVVFLKELDSCWS